jgi:hypothetical protein
MASNNDTANSAAAAEPSSAVVRGALVVLEGLDRSGKSTQVQLLEERFLKLEKKVRVMRFPGTKISLSFPSHPESQHHVVEGILLSFSSLVRLCIVNMKFTKKTEPHPSAR